MNKMGTPKPRATQQQATPQAGAETPRKQRRPRFYEPEVPPQPTHCQHPDCDKPGVYRAPKSRKQLNEYFWFCLDHVRDYNKAWDYYAGMSETEQLSPKTKDAKAREASNRESWGAACDAVLARIPREPSHATSALIEANLRREGLALGEKKLKRIFEYLASEDGGSVIRDMSDGAQSKPRRWARKAGDE